MRIRVPVQKNIIAARLQVPSLVNLIGYAISGRFHIILIIWPHRAIIWWLKLWDWRQARFEAHHFRLHMCTRIPGSYHILLSSSFRLRVLDRHSTRPDGSGGPWTQPDLIKFNIMINFRRTNSNNLLALLDHQSSQVNNLKRTDWPLQNTQAAIHWSNKRNRLWYVVWGECAKRTCDRVCNVWIVAKFQWNKRVSDLHQFTIICSW